MLKTNYKLVIAGAGPQEENLKKMAEDLDLKEKIIFAGFQKENNLWDLVRGAEFIVVPSRWHENAPYNVVEAMGLTKMVICTKIGGLSEIIEDEKTGFLFTPGNIEEMAEKMKKAIDLNGEAKKRMEESAKAAVKEKNDKENYYNNLINIYEEISTKYKK